MLRRFVVLAAFLALTLPSLAAAQTLRTRLGVAPAPPRVVFYGQPRFVTIPGTDVYTLQSTDGSYDLYSYGGYYYLSSNGWWYRSTNPRGPFRVIQDNMVPDDVFVAIDNTPDVEWDDGAVTPPRIVFSERPRLAMVRGTDVYRVVNAPGDYRIYRYGNTYYINDGDTWFSSTRVRGPYTAIRAEVLPRPVYTVVTTRTTYRSHHRTWRRY